VDVNGNVVSTASGNCPYGWKLTWTDSGHSNTKIFGYL